MSCYCIGAVNLVISTPGGDARFRCLSSSAIGVEWLVNGTLLENLNLNNVTTEFAEGIGGALLLTNLPVDYNMTRITCKVDESSSVSNTTSLLLLQGNISSYMHQPHILATYTALGNTYRSSLCCGFSYNNCTRLCHLSHLDSSLHLGYTRC